MHEDHRAAEGDDAQPQPAIVATPTPTPTPDLDPDPEPAPTKSLEDLTGVRTIESMVPLAHSALWSMERAFYESSDTHDWAVGTIPHHITTNPGIAAGYAETIVGFARDCRAQGLLAPGAVLRVVEVGGGTGRFAALLLRALGDLLAGTSLADVEVRYVLTDFAAERLGQWSANPVLAAEQASGRLRVLTLDATDPVASEVAQERFALDPGEIAGPVVLVANYVLDSLPQVAVALRGGAVLAGLVSLVEPADGRPADAPVDVSTLEVEWDFLPRPIEGLDDDLRPVLADYQEALDDTVVLLPSTGVRLLGALCRDRAAPALALVSDKGTTGRRDLLGQGPPALAFHGGGFSLMVNFDALGGAVGRWGAQVLAPPGRAAHLVSCAYVFPPRAADGAQPPAWPEATRAYARHLGEHGPDDQYLLLTMIADGEISASVEQLLAILRLFHWDPATFLRLAPRLLELAPEIADPWRSEVARCLRRVWAAYVPIGEQAEVATLIGLVLSGMRLHREALGYFEEAVAEHGQSSNALFGAALSHLELGDPETARTSAQAALAADPGFGAARALLVTLAEEPS